MIFTQGLDGESGLLGKKGSIGLKVREYSNQHMSDLIC